MGGGGEALLANMFTRSDPIVTIRYKRGRVCLTMALSFPPPLLEPPPQKPLEAKGQMLRFETGVSRMPKLSKGVIAYKPKWKVGLVIILVFVKVSEMYQFHFALWITQSKANW